MTSVPTGACWEAAAARDGEAVAPVLVAEVPCEGFVLLPPGVEVPDAEAGLRAHSLNKEFGRRNL